MRCWEEETIGPPALRALGIHFKGGGSSWPIPPVLQSKGLGPDVPNAMADDAAEAWRIAVGKLERVAENTTLKKAGKRNQGE